MRIRQTTMPAVASTLLVLGTVLAPAQAAEPSAEPEAATKRVVVTNKSGSIAAGSLGTRVSIAPRRKSVGSNAD